MVKAKLIIDGKEINVLWFTFSFNQGADQSGRPSQRPVFVGLKLIIETRKDLNLADWSFAPNLTKQIELHIYPVILGGRTRKLYFYDCHLVNWKNAFSSTGSNPMSETLEITCAGVEDSTSEAVYSAYWRTTFKNTVAPTVIDREEVEQEEEEENDEFGITIKHVADKKTFVPLGIPAFSGTPENKNIEFEIKITENDIDDFQVEFLHDNKVMQTYYSSRQTLDEVVVTAKGSGNSSNSNTTDNENEQSNYSKGKYKLEWDGFDSNGIYDNTVFTSGKFKARIKGSRNGNEKTAESTEFSFKYKEVNWVDTKIDRNNKRIDVTLRVNLKDGGAKGLKKWNKIPKKDLTSKEPIKIRTKSFEDLEKLAIDGLNYHWGRNKNHYIAKNVDINGELYEIFINAINTAENVMDDVSLVFNTNRKWMRSGNPGTVEDPISAVGNLISREAICYNVGYVKSKLWRYRESYNEDIDFKETSAHEIGHTILKAYGGTFYSYGHKGTVNTITQSENSNATDYPKTGEIDIMPYYTDWLDYSQRKRMIASQKDTLSLIWLTKIELR